MVRNILVPVDMSRYSLKAARTAIQLAAALHARITIIHVVEIHPHFAVPEYLMSKDDRVLKEIRRDVERWLTKIEKMAKSQNVTMKYEILLRSTSVVESIVQYAKRKKMNIIVIGTRGRTGFERLLLGSVAHGVSQHAPCSVMIVR
jgi:nucleotide-binding universal stress UspA family protein